MSGILSLAGMVAFKPTSMTSKKGTHYIAFPLATANGISTCMAFEPIASALESFSYPRKLILSGKMMDGKLFVSAFACEGEQAAVNRQVREPVKEKTHIDNLCEVLGESYVTKKLMEFVKAGGSVTSKAYSDFIDSLSMEALEKEDN